MSSIEAALLRRLDDLQKQFAVEALQTPSAPTEFEYGKACGVVSGIERSKQVLLELLEEHERST